MITFVPVQANKHLLFFILLIAALGIGCGGRDYKAMYEYSGYAQGASYHVICDAEAPLDNELKKLLSSLDRSISVWDSMSLVSQFNRSTNGVHVDQHFIKAFQLAKKIHQETDGAFNPAAYTFTDKRDTTKQLPTDSLLKYSQFKDVYLNISDSISSTGKTYFLYKRYKQTKISFMGLGQGYAVDLMSDFLDGKGIQNYRVTVGSTSKAKGLDRHQKPWKTFIDKPQPKNHHREIQSIITIGEKPFSVVGDYQEYYQNGGQRYNLYINPETGKLCENTLLNATVFATSAAEAEAYGTAFMVMGAGKATQFLQRRKDLYAYMISSGFEEQDFQTWMSPELEKMVEEFK